MKQNNMKHILRAGINKFMFLTNKTLFLLNSDTGIGILRATTAATRLFFKRVLRLKRSVPWRLFFFRGQHAKAF